ncbi:MAG: hypothetical protein U0R44_01595 [Candidatus Micrarchaeia archaeon]
MARAETAQSFLQTIPENQREIASRIIGSVPAAARPEAIRTIQSILSHFGPNARDGLLHLQSISSGENFRPAYFGTVRLIIERAGTHALPALSEYAHLASSERFNVHVDQTARLTVVRSGEDSAEGLRALRFLVSNPNFSERSLNAALPDRFLAFIDSARSAGGDHSFHALRALGSLFCNEHFAPADLNARAARNFGALVRAVIEANRSTAMDGLEALGSLLGNGSIRPQSVSEETARTIAALVARIIEDLNSLARYGRAVANTTNMIAPEGAARSVISDAETAEPQYTVAGTLRALNLILGDRDFSLGMIGPDGEFSRLIGHEGIGIGQATTDFRSFLHHSHHHPNAIPAAQALIGQGLSPLAAYQLIDSFLANPGLSSAVDRPEFIPWITGILRAGETEPEGGRNQFTGMVMGAPASLRNPPVLGALWLIATSEAGPETFGRILAMSAALGPRAGVGIYLAGHALSRRGAAYGERFFADLTRLSEQASAISGAARRSLAMILASDGFRPEMIDHDSGIVPFTLGVQSDRLEGALEAAEGIIGSWHMLPGIERAFRAVLTTARAEPQALAALGGLLNRTDFRDEYLPALMSVIRTCGTRSWQGLGLFMSAMSNPSLAGSLTSEDFGRDLGRVAIHMNTGNDDSTRQAVAAAATIIGDRRFTPAMMERLRFLYQISGASAPYVFRYIAAMTEDPNADLSRLLSNDILELLVRIANEVQSHAGTGREYTHDALCGIFRSSYTSVIHLSSQSDELIASIQAFVRGSGEHASITMRSFLPSLMSGVLTPEASETAGRWAARYLSRFPPERMTEAQEAVAEMFAGIAVSPDLADILLDHPERYERGRALAQSMVRAPYISPMVYLNFADAIERIGEERTRELYRSYGIRYFARYSTAMLNEMYENRDPARARERPMLLVIYPHSDFNGAFYDSREQLDQLRRHFNVIVYERGDEEGAFRAAEEFGRRYGRSSTVLIGGHGSPDSIRLGEATDAGMLDLTDEAGLARFRTALGPDPTVILQSCSTGRDQGSIGAMISRVLGARLFAPTVPGRIDGFEFDDEGRVSNVRYTVGHHVFNRGVQARR